MLDNKQAIKDSQDLIGTHRILILTLCLKFIKSGNEKNPNTLKFKNQYENRQPEY